jgi:SAM-dependent methyltransferase
MYRALWDPAAGWRIRVSQLKGLDQTGHFGSDGCDLIVSTIEECALPEPMRMIELGSGFGGALRYVVDRLGGSRRVGLAVGLELIQDHCRLAERLNRTFDAGGLLPMICTSVDAPGIVSAAFDVVFSTGAMSHFDTASAVIGEAYRMLRPGGVLTFTEEVSVMGEAGEPSSAFQSLHPSSVFGRTTKAQRLDQLMSAGFVDVTVAEIGAWAAAVLRRRLFALRVQRPAVERFYGEDEARRIVDTLAAVRQEIVEDRLRPIHVMARRQGDAVVDRMSD